MTSSTWVRRPWSIQNCKRFYQTLKSCLTSPKNGSYTVTVFNEKSYRGIYKVQCTVASNLLLERPFGSRNLSFLTSQQTKVSEQVKKLDSASEEAFRNLSIREETKQRLLALGITGLFPVQRECWQPIWDSKDVILRAQTGTGKTIAYALPLLERLASGDLKARNQPGSPAIVVLTPTRELAKQVYEEFKKLEPSAPGACIYGGSAYAPQERMLMQPLSYLVGTPGRVSDMKRRGLLHLDSVSCIVLDEADRMLEIGFADELDQILEALPAAKQTLMFSATVPRWVQQQSSKNMRNPVFIDLVKSTTSKIPQGVKHYAVSVPPFAKDVVVGDILSVFGGEKCMIFTPTKREADALAASEHVREESTVIHGDIPQEGRELAIEGFRKGKFRHLIATDVAARGIDIPSVDFVLMTYTPSPTPEGVDMYIHRSGRTGRAGREGKSVILYSEGEKDKLERLEKLLSIRFERLSPPSSNQLLAASLERAWRRVSSTPQSLVSQVLPLVSEKLNHLSISTVSQVDVTVEEEHSQVETPSGVSNIIASETMENKMKLLLAAALAQLGGLKLQLEERSLLTYRPGLKTFLIRDERPSSKRKGMSVSFVRRLLMNALASELKSEEDLPKVVIFQSGLQAIVDVPVKAATLLLERGIGVGSHFLVEPVKQLSPEMLQALEDSVNFRRNQPVTRVQKETNRNRRGVDNRKRQYSSFDEIYDKYSL